MNKRLNTRDYESLSAYLDGELQERERVKLEARLSQQPDLRAGLEQLRQTRLFLRSLPQKKAPRNFTIRAELAPRRNPPRVYPFLRLASALASVLFVLVIAGDLALGAAPKSIVSRFVPQSATQTASILLNIPTENPPAPIGPGPVAPYAPVAPLAGGPAATSAAGQAAPLTAPAPVEPPAAPTEEISPAAAPTEEPTVEPNTLAAGSGPSADCGSACTPTPTQTEAEISGLSVTRSAVGISPQTNANAKPTDTPAPTAAPTETPEPTDAGVPVFHTYGAPATAPASDGYQETPAPYPPAPETRTNILPQLKSGAGPGAAQVFPTVVIPSQVPPAGLGPLTTPVPGTNPVQEYIRPILRSSEFFLAGLAILAGLAALILRWTAR